MDADEATKTVLPKGAGGEVGSAGGRKQPVRCGVLLLGACAVLGACLRFLALDFGLPGADARPDEYHQVVDEAMEMLETARLLPRTYTYPTLFKYAAALSYTAYYAAGRLSGRQGSFDDFLFAYGTDPSKFILIARVLSALAGTTTILLIYALGRACLDEVAGISAALILSVSFLHVRDSHFGTTDCMATMLWTAAACAAVGLLRDGATKRYALCGALCGLAAAAKYPAGAVLFSLISAHVLRTRRLRGRFSDSLRPRFAGKLLVGLCAAALAFAIGNPGAIVEPYRVFSDIVIEATQHAETEMYRGKTMIGWVWHCGFTLRYGLGIPLLYMGLVGLALCLVRRQDCGMTALAGVAVYCAVICSGYQAFTRYMVPMTPFVALGAAAAIKETLKQSAGIASRLLKMPPASVAAMTQSAVVNFIFAFLLCIPSIHSCIALDMLLARKDTRQLAAEEILRTVPAGASIGHIGSMWGAPVLPVAKHVWQRRAAFNPRPLFNVMAKRASGRKGYDIGYWYIDKGLYGKNLESLRDYQYLTVEHSPLKDFSTPPEGLERVLAGYEPIWRINPYLKNAGKAAYDQIDAFFVPLSGFESVSNPGPALTLYRRK